jgi:hypothetical protein
MTLEDGSARFQRAALGILPSAMKASPCGAPEALRQDAAKSTLEACATVAYLSAGAPSIFRLSDDPASSEFAMTIL